MTGRGDALKGEATIETRPVPIRSVGTTISKYNSINVVGISRRRTRDSPRTRSGRTVVQRYNACPEAVEFTNYSPGAQRPSRRRSRAGRVRRPGCPVTHRDHLIPCRADFDNEHGDTLRRRPSHIERVRERASSPQRRSTAGRTSRSQNSASATTAAANSLPHPHQRRGSASASPARPRSSDAALTPRPANDAGAARRRLRPGVRHPGDRRGVPRHRHSTATVRSAPAPMPPTRTRSMPTPTAVSSGLACRGALTTRAAAAR